MVLSEVLTSATSKPWAGQRWGWDSNSCGLGPELLITLCDLRGMTIWDEWFKKKLFDRWRTGLLSLGFPESRAQSCRRTAVPGNRCEGWERQAGWRDSQAGSLPHAHCWGGASNLTPDGPRVGGLYALLITGFTWKHLQVWKRKTLKRVVPFPSPSSFHQREEKAGWKNLVSRPNSLSGKQPCLLSGLLWSHIIHLEMEGRGCPCTKSTAGVQRFTQGAWSPLLAKQPAGLWECPEEPDAILCPHGP